MPDKITIENYCFSQLENYCCKNLTVFENWTKSLTALYQSLHLHDTFGDYKIFSVIREVSVDTFRFAGKIDFKKNIVFLNKSKIQPAIGIFYEILSLPYQNGKKNFKEAGVIGNLFVVKEKDLIDFNHKALFSERKSGDKSVKSENKKKRQYELIPGLFCFHTKDASKQILIFTGSKNND